MTDNNFIPKACCTLNISGADQKWKDMVGIKFVVYSSYLKGILSSPIVMNEISDYILSFADPPMEQIEKFIAQGKRKKLKKKQVFTEAGEICDRLAFIHRGILRYHLISVKTGTDHTKDFSFAFSFCTAFTSAITRTPSQIYISAVEDTELTIWPFTDMQIFYAQDIEWQKFGRKLAEMLYIRKEQREVAFLLNSAEERYKKMLQEFPEALHRIPQYHIASYLGITPETLSRLKKNLDIHQ